MNRKLLILVLFLFTTGGLSAQVVKSVVLDSVMIQAVKQGFDVSDFIDMVQSDTSFLIGFRNLRNAPHEVRSQMKIYNNSRSKIRATRNIIALQKTRDQKRWIEIQSEKITGKFYKRNELPSTYTAELFDELFLYKDTLPVIPVYLSGTRVSDKNKSNISKLKTLIFNPGAEIDNVPLVGSRLAIFSDDMTEYYDYRISYRIYHDTVPCYVFSCAVKPDAGSYPVLKYLNTWFDRSTFNIVYRDYHYEYSGLLFSFDVKIAVVMDYYLNTLYPQVINYSGFWDIPFRKQETVDFDLLFKLVK